jgi:hypothetical protein
MVEQMDIKRYSSYWVFGLVVIQRYILKNEFVKESMLPQHYVSNESVANFVPYGICYIFA